MGNDQFLQAKPAWGLKEMNHPCSPFLVKHQTSKTEAFLLFKKRVYNRKSPPSTTQRKISYRASPNFLRCAFCSSNE